MSITIRAPEDDILDRVTHILSEELGISPRDITQNTPLGDVFKDALDYTLLSLVLGDEFEVELLDFQLADMKTVRDIVAYIRERTR